MGITKDVTTDYGVNNLDNTGVTPITSRMFGAIRTDMTGQDFVNFTFPAGTYASQGFGGPAWVPNCGDLTINAAGATFIDKLGDGACDLASSIGVAQIGIDATVRTPSGFSTPGGKSARINTCYPGATSVTLTSTGAPSGGGSAGAGHISRFAVGQWAMICGWTIQGDFQNPYSFPPNFQYFDFVKITAINANTITFDNHPLTYLYDQNWPEVNRGNEFECDGAGPATIFAMSLDWDGRTTLNDGTMSITPAGSTYINNVRRETVINNFPQTGKTFYPSMTRLFKAVNSPATAVSVEHDKLNELVDVSGGTYGTQWHVQSSSTKMFKIENVTLGTNFNGTGRVIEATNCTVGANVQLGPTSYGQGVSAKFTDCTINGIVSGLNQTKGTKNQDQGVQDAIMGMSGGVLTMPMNCGAELLYRLIPDPKGKSIFIWGGDLGAYGSVQVLSATSDRWPAVDDATTTIGISFTTGTKTLTTDTPLFTPGDVGKTIFLPGVTNNSAFGNCTITNSTPGLITTKNTNGTTRNHILVVNEPVRFRAGPSGPPDNAGGTLPSGIVANTVYYVKNPTSTTFEIAATPGGASIATSGGSGTVQVNYVGDTYSHIVSYVNSTTVTVFDTLSALGNFSSVVRTLRYGTCNAYLTTNWTGAKPSPSVLYPSGGKMSFYHPGVSSCTFTNCTGTPQVLDLSQPAARGRPFASYTKRNFNAQTGFTGNSGREYREPSNPTTSIALIGRVTSIKVNVITPYSGTGTLTMQPLLRGLNGDLYTGVSQFYGPVINLKQPGERVFLPGVAATGSQTGDTLTMLPAQFFNHGSYYPALSRSIQSEGPGDWTGPAPDFTVEIITDQGFASDAVSVVRFGGFRLHA